MSQKQATGAFTCAVCHCPRNKKQRSKRAPGWCIRCARRLLKPAPLGGPP